MRNPLDVVTSMFNFWASQTQNLSIETQDFHERYAADWANLVQQEISCWRDFHNFWLHKARNESVPVLFFRFEDITKDPKPVLMDVFAFTLGRESVAGSLIEGKIDFLMRKKAAGAMQTQLYKPREAAANNKNLARFSPEQLAWIQTELAPLIDFFEYNNGPTNFFSEIAVSETCSKFKEFNAD